MWRAKGEGGKGRKGGGAMLTLSGKFAILRPCVGVRGKGGVGVKGKIRVGF